MATYLPPEVMEKILSRLPVKSLLRFKSVCNSWNALVSSHPFIRTHLLHSSQSHTLFIQEYLCYCQKQNILRFQDGQFHVHDNPNFLLLWCSCNGILLLEDLNEYKDTSTGLGDLILWNPSMRKITQLFLPPVVSDRGRLVNYGLCYDPATVDLKVVFFYGDMIFRDDICDAAYAVYSCKNKSWSMHNEVMAENIIYRLYSIHPSEMVCVDGALYWVTRGVDTSKCGDLLCFESEGNKLKTVQRPIDLKESNDEYCVISLRGRLCVWWCSKSVARIWMREEGEDWRDFMRIEDIVHPCVWWCSKSVARIWMREEGEDWRDFMRIEDIVHPCCYCLKQPLSVNMDEGENIEIAVCSETYYYRIRSVGVPEARRRVVIVLEEFNLPLNVNGDAIVCLSSFDSLLFFDQHPAPAADLLMQTQAVEQFKRF